MCLIGYNNLNPKQLKQNEALINEHQHTINIKQLLNTFSLTIP